MNYKEFLNRIREIKQLGYVKSHRKGDTGIGKTLEDLLGITENNIACPDFSIYELKSGRKDSTSMLTLFTKTPMPKGAIKKLLEVFGYEQRKKIVTLLKQSWQIIPMEGRMTMELDFVYCPNICLSALKRWKRSFRAA
jgi:hypothetical protein